MKNGKKQRAKRREYYKELDNKFKPYFNCPNCNELTQWGHMVPSCFGDPGFWTCNGQMVPINED